MSQIKHYKVSYINLAAGVVFEHNMDKAVNLVFVRNPSAVDRVLFGDDSGISANRYQVSADIDSAGVFVRPDTFKTVYFLSVGAITRLVIEEYLVDEPAIFIVQGSKGVSTDVNVLSSVLPGGAATQVTLAAILAKIIATPATEGTAANILTKLAAVDLQGVTGVKITRAGGAGDEVVKATPGKVYAIRAAAGVNVTLKDNVTEKWYIPAATKDEFSQPIACGTNITLSFDAAGDAWIIYQ